MTLERNVLVFPSLNQLWNFVREAKINYSEFSAENATIVCDCSKLDVELARNKFGAIIWSETVY